MQGDKGSESTVTLILKVREGDSRARDVLLKRCLPIVRRWAHGKLPRSARSLAETDDLVQITLIRAFDSIPRLRSDRAESFWTYIRRILLNLVRDEIRSHRQIVATTAIEEDANDLPAAENAETSQARIEFEHALSGLKKREQGLIIMRMEFGLSYAEIAAEVDSTPDAVRVMISRAIAKMARRLDDG